MDKWFILITGGNEYRLALAWKFFRTLSNPKPGKQTAVSTGTRITPIAVNLPNFS